MSGFVLSFSLPSLEQACSFSNKQNKKTWEDLVKRGSKAHNLGQQVRNMKTCKKAESEVDDGEELDDTLADDEDEDKIKQRQQQEDAEDPMDSEDEEFLAPEDDEDD